MSLYRCLIIGARCCFQFYPDNAEQIDMITNAALEAGFTGGVVVDFPHSTKAKKYYLFIQAGYTKESLNEVMNTIKENQEDESDSNEQVKYQTKRAKMKNKRSNNKKVAFKSREWIQNKKDRQRRKGNTARPDSKYTGRRRAGKGF